MSLPFKKKFEQIDIMKKQVFDLKDRIDNKKNSLITIKHAKFVEDMVLCLESVYNKQ